MFRRFLFIAALSFFLLPACIQKPDPVIPDPPDVPDVPDVPDTPVEPEKPKDKEVTLMAEFTEEFSARGSEYFDFGYRESGDDFRYYPGFPSMSESGNTILMLRLDTSDGPGIGSVVSAKDYTFYGSYSIRLRIPDIVAVQRKLGACADFVLYDDDSVYGVDEISLSLRLADQGGVYLALNHTDADGSNKVSFSEAVVPALDGFNAATKNYIYGFDWAEGSFEWWMKAKPSGDKIVLKTVTENVPSQPLKLKLRYYHSQNAPTRDNADATQSPNYPYELETDWIKYTPLQ